VATRHHHPRLVGLGNARVARDALVRDAAHLPEPAAAVLKPESLGQRVAELLEDELLQRVTEGARLLEDVCLLAGLVLEDDPRRAFPRRRRPVTELRAIPPLGAEHALLERIALLVDIDLELVDLVAEEEPDRCARGLGGGPGPRDDQVAPREVLVEARGAIVSGARVGDD